MKQYLIIKRARGGILKDEIDTTIYTDENLNEALELCRVNNTSIELRQYKWEVVELTSLIQVKAERDMSEDELKEYASAISKMDDDLNEIIDYDEWAGREYGETNVDYWYSAKNLYNAGYRKITKIEE